MVVKNEIKKTYAYKMAFYKYKQRTKKRHLAEIVGFSGAFIIFAILVFNGTFTIKEFITYGIVNEPIEAIVIICLIPSFLTFIIAMLGMINVYEIYVEDIKKYSESSSVSGDNGFVEKIIVYENGIPYYFEEPCSFKMEKGKTYFIAGKGRKLFFVVKEK